VIHDSDLLNLLVENLFHGPGRKIQCLFHAVPESLVEKAFEIKIPREELFPIEGMMSNPEFVADGKLTEKGLAEMERTMPHTDFESFKANPDINKLGDLFTVDSIVNYIETKLAA